MHGRHSDVRRRGARPLVVPHRPRRRHRGDPRPAPVPDRTPGGRRSAGHAAAVDDRHALPRGLRHRQPGACCTGRCDVHRSSNFAARDTSPTSAGRRTRRPGGGGGPAGDGDARAHARPPRLSPRAQRFSGCAVQRWFLDGRRRRAYRSVWSGSRRAAGARDVPLAATSRRAPRRPRRVPDPRRRFVLLRSGRRGPHDHVGTRTGNQRSVPDRRRGRIRRTAARRVRVVPDLLRPAARAEPARTTAVPAAPATRPARCRRRSIGTSATAR